MVQGDRYEKGALSEMRGCTRHSHELRLVGLSIQTRDDIRADTNVSTTRRMMG